MANAPPNPFLLVSVREENRRRLAQEQKRTRTLLDIAAEQRRKPPFLPGPGPDVTPTPVPTPRPPVVGRPRLPPAAMEGIAPVLAGAFRIGLGAVRGLGQEIRQLPASLSMEPEPGQFPGYEELGRKIREGEEKYRKSVGAFALVGVTRPLEVINQLIEGDRPKLEKLEETLQRYESIKTPKYLKGVLETVGDLPLWVYGPGAVKGIAESFPRVAKVILQGIAKTPAVREAALKAAMPLQMAGRGLGMEPAKVLPLREPAVEYISAMRGRYLKAQTISTKRKIEAEFLKAHGLESIPIGSKWGRATEKVTEAAPQEQIDFIMARLRGEAPPLSPSQEAEYFAAQAPLKAAAERRAALARGQQEMMAPARAAEPLAPAAVSRAAVPRPIGTVPPAVPPPVAVRQPPVPFRKGPYPEPAPVGPGKPPVQPPTAGGVPPVPPTEPFAANIRLSKFPEEVRSTIKAWADAHPDLVQEARRGVRSDAQVLEDARSLVNEVGGDFAKLQKRWKPGQAWNAEEITAIRGSLSDATRRLLEIQRTIKAGADNTENLLSLQQALLEHAQIQTTVHGITAEAGRSLRSFRQSITEALASGDAVKMEQILKKIGDRAKVEELARKLGQLDLGNPAQVAAFIRSTLKPKFTDYVVEYYINSLLSGPTTHMVNSISNATMAALAPARSTLAATMEMGLARLQGRARERFFAEVPAAIIGSFRGVPEGVRAALYTLRNGMRPLAASKYELPRMRAFTGPVGRVVNLPSNAMEAMDAFFYHINFRAAFNQQAVRLARMKPEPGTSFAEQVVKIKLDPPADLIEKADKMAEELLFRAEPGTFTQAIMGLRDKTLLGVPVGRFFLPFVRTPANILKVGLGHTPLGVLDPKLWRNLMAKSPEAADQLARITLGSAVSVALVTYFAEGRITGPAPTNPAERDRFYRDGKLPWAIKIGDRWIQYRRVEPLNMPLSLIAGVLQAVEKGEEQDALSKAATVAAYMGRNIADQTFLTGIGNLMDALEDPERWGARFLQNLGLSFIPYSRGLAQLAASIEPYYKAPTNFLEAAKAQIPGLSAGVPPKLTVFGEEIKRTSPAWWPIAYSPAKEDFLISELERLQINIGFAAKTIGGRELTAFEQQQYQELSGKFIKGSLLLLVAQSEYVPLSDVDKEKAISRVSDKARDEARNILSGESTFEEAEKSLRRYVASTLKPLKTRHLQLRRRTTATKAGRWRTRRLAATARR